MPSQLLDLMEDTIPFKHIPPKIRGELARFMRLREMTEQAAIFQQGAHVPAVYVVQSGGVRLVNYTPDGQIVTLALLGPGEVFGLVEVMGNTPAMAAAESLKNGKLIALTAGHFHDLTRKHTALSAVVSNYLTEHLTRGYDRIQQLASMTVEQRLACCVQQLATQFGVETNEGIMIDLTVSRQFLAETIGTRLETVSRILRAWEREGFVKTGRESLVVVELEAICDVSTRT